MFIFQMENSWIFFNQILLIDISIYVIELLVCSRHRLEINCIIHIFRSIQSSTDCLQRLFVAFRLHHMLRRVQTACYILFVRKATILLQLVLSVFVAIPLLARILHTNQSYSSINCVKTKEDQWRSMALAFEWINSVQNKESRVECDRKYVHIQCERMHIVFHSKTMRFFFISFHLIFNLKSLLKIN